MPLNNAAARPTKTHFHGLEINPQMRIHWNLKERIVMFGHIAKHQLTNLSVDYRIQELHRRLGISNMGQKYIEVIYPRLYTALRARIDELRSSPDHSPMLVGVVEKGGRMRFYPKFMDAWARHGWDGDMSKPPPDDEVDRQSDDRDEACVILDDEVEPEPEPGQEGQQQEGEVWDGREADDSVVRIELEAASAASIISPPTPAPVIIPLPSPAPAPAGSLGKSPPRPLRCPNGPPRSRDENGFVTGQEVFTFQGAAPPPLRPSQRPDAAGSAACQDSHHRAALRRSRVFHSGGSKIPLLVIGGGVPMLPPPPPIPGFAHQQHPTRDAAAATATAAFAGSSPSRRALVLATPCHVTHEMLKQYKAAMMRLVELDMERRLCEVEAVKCLVLADAEMAEARMRRARQIVADDAYEVRSRLVYLDRELEKRGYTSGGQGLGPVAALSLVSLGLASDGLAWSGGR
ncbi:uncharacterized protein LY79DRAFT_56015 [Colletotrichum navitas]|uniref:Uncharacterized protein n=1 Tax=Colletotrichum navitas TaxID=681940 RepID=A0AAD8PLN2_9PEZI|nr:uncharacterized protein LY79DRAFT_56015 [Colletotrichum navitas]KAK1570005.1 hypothetical protein LY79DRAFT_56015 [Colletotrichum navitas]